MRHLTGLAFRRLIRPAHWALLPAAVLLSTATTAHSCPLGDDWGMFMVLMAIGLFVYPVYVLVMWLIEAAVLRRALQVGFWRALWFSFAANAASIAVGLEWSDRTGQRGWKATLLTGQWDRVGLLFFRSFVVTVAVQTVVVLLLMGRRADVRFGFRAVLLANVATYAATLPVLAMLASALHTR